MVPLPKSVSWGNAGQALHSNNRNEMNHTYVQNQLGGLLPPNPSITYKATNTGMWHEKKPLHLSTLVSLVLPRLLDPM